MSFGVEHAAARAQDDKICIHGLSFIINMKKFNIGFEKRK